MTFDDLVNGDAVFIDANVLIYNFAPDPVLGTVCNRLIQRVENQELSGFVSTHVLSELAHRLMTIEAVHKFNWPTLGIGNRLRTHPSNVQQLTAFHFAVEKVVQSKMQILTIDSSHMMAAVDLCQKIGLLINDAITVALMQAHGLTKIASHDDDFENIPGLTRYAPI